MAEQNHGFRKFIMDPKSSVMTYLAENIPQERLSQQQNGTHVAQNNLHQSPQLANQTSAQSQSGQHLDPAHQYNEDSNAHLRPVDHLQPAGSISQHNSPQLAYVNPTQSAFASNGVIYSSAENVQGQAPIVSGTISNGHYVPYPETPLGYHAAGYEQQIESNSGPAQAQNLIPHQAVPQQPQYTSRQNNSQSVSAISPSTPSRPKTLTPCSKATSRLYYRTLLDFETTKFAFFLAKTGDRTQDSISAAYKLESLSRRLLSLRSENLQDFDGFTDAGHSSETARLQTESQLWAATVLDIQESPSGQRPQMLPTGYEANPNAPYNNNNNTSSPPPQNQLPSTARLSTSTTAFLSHYAKSFALHAAKPTPVPTTPTYTKHAIPFRTHELESFAPHHAAKPTPSPSLPTTPTSTKHPKPGQPARTHDLEPATAEPFRAHDDLEPPTAEPDAVRDAGPEPEPDAVKTAIEKIEKWRKRGSRVGV
ncbi:MAG: hypothetical protein Q9195_006999 [Heterodermia aff. obscurata]